MNWFLNNRDYLTVVSVAIPNTGYKYSCSHKLERYIAWFNWHVKEIMPYYRAEVMRLHSITSDEYDSHILEGDRSIYLPQPNPMFEPTHYDEKIR